MRRLVGRSLVLLVLVLGSGCMSVERLAATLESRQVNSCIYFTGAYAAFLGVHGVVATGGARVETCLERR